MRVVVDGVFFQLNNTGIARVWEAVLNSLAGRADLEIFLLDRGRSPEIAGITNIPFPTRKDNDVAADSLLLQQFCDDLRADVFTSTYYTTPTRTPMVLMVYDMIPEIFDFDLTHRHWSEKETAIAFAQQYLCISHSTRKDLLHFYPEIDPDTAQVAYCGVDTQAFGKRSTAEIRDFRAQHGLDRPYFLFVGTRVQHTAYKNSGLFFNALRQMETADFDVFCVGGEPQIEQSVLDGLPAGVRCQRVVLSDYDLSRAYAGAAALIYPSLYEGFGMPVIEAMASGCPVITTRRGSLAEAAGDAALLVEGTSVPEMKEALHSIQQPSVQKDLRARGFAQAAKFRWAPMADLLLTQLRAGAATGTDPRAQAFFDKWHALRRLQAQVDYL